jgi:hypothetical protein
VFGIPFLGLLSLGYWLWWPSRLRR